MLRGLSLRHSNRIGSALNEQIIPYLIYAGSDLSHKREAIERGAQGSTNPPARNDISKKHFRTRTYNKT